MQLLVPPLGNLLTLKFLTFRTSFSVFHRLPALSISRAREAITKTIPRDRRKLIKLMLRKCTFLPPRSHLIGQFVKRHLVTIRREQRVLAQWLRQYFCQDHGVRSVLWPNTPQRYTVLTFLRRSAALIRNEVLHQICPQMLRSLLFSIYKRSYSQICLRYFCHNISIRGNAAADKYAPKLLFSPSTLLYSCGNVAMTK